MGIILKRLRRYSIVVALVLGMIVLVLSTLAMTIHYASTVLLVDSAAASRSGTLQDILLRVGPQNVRTLRDIQSHISLIKDGGTLQTPYGSDYALSKSEDENVIASINQLQALLNNKAYEQIPDAYGNFLNAHISDNLDRSNLFNAYQIAAGLLIFLGFLAILFLLIFRLGRSDEKLEQTLQGNQDILDAINEGLFLIDKDFQIGSVQSEATQSILEVNGKLEGNFFNFIQPLLSNEDLADTKDYISLLLEGRGNQSLLKDLNPLREVRVGVNKGDGVKNSKYLNFDFSRTFQQKEIGILVSVNDVTERVDLRRELEGATTDSEDRFETLMSSLGANHEDIESYYEATGQSLEQVNELLRDKDNAHQNNVQKINEIYRIIHKIKGNSSAVGIKLIESSAHNFESKIEEIKALPNIDGNQILGLTVLLRRMIGELGFLQDLSTKLDQGAAGKGSGASTAFINSDEGLAAQMSDPNSGVQSIAEETNTLKRFANEVAERQGKSVNLEIRGLEEMPLNSKAEKEVEALCIQLIRNAVVHGIEETDVRRILNKPSAGQITINMQEKTDRSLLLTIRDDGAGLNFPKIREKAVAQGLISARQALELKTIDVVRCIFKPGFSTADDATQDSGRGYGLDIVKAEVASLGGSIGVKSAKGLYSQFSIKLPSSIRTMKIADAN